MWYLIVSIPDLCTFTYSFNIPHASYAYQNIGYMYVTDVKEIYAEKNQLPSMTSKRIHDLIKLLMFIGVSIQQRISLQKYHRLTNKVIL